MLPPGTRAFTPVALAARVSPAPCASRVHHRPFFAWSGPPSRNGGGDGSGSASSSSSSGANSTSTASTASNNDAGGKPDPEPEHVPEDDVDTHAATATDVAGGRSRSHVLAAQKGRQARKRAAAALPPVTLPKSFLDNNVWLYRMDKQPQLPIALAHDATTDKVSRLFKKSDRHVDPDPHHDAVEFFFQTTLDTLLRKESEAYQTLDQPPTKSHTILWMHPEPIAEIVRYWDMIIDSAWHLTDALYPARQPEYTYKTRPWWWWHYYRDYDRRDHSFGTQPQLLGAYLRMDMHYHKIFDVPLAHAMADLSVPVFRAVESSIQRDVSLLPSPEFDSKICKRQLTILSLTGYSGKSVPEAIGNYAAHASGLDVVRMDSYDLSVLVGDYLGQNWAYSRGSLSMLGFRAAELNGRIARDPEFTYRSPDDEDADSETAYINIRNGPGQLDEELQKIKQGSYECFSKWDNLKIDKMLDHIIRSPDSIKNQQRSSKGVLIHIHDFVELSMTLEGAWLIGRLRALVDAAWQQGVKIAILGTSATEKPSDEYHNTIRDLAVEDFVISRHLDPGRADHQTRPDDARIARFHLQKADKFVENIENIKRMLHAMDPGFSDTVDVAQILANKYEALWNFGLMHNSVLPIPEVYNMALAFKAVLAVPDADGSDGLIERSILGSLRDNKPGSTHLTPGIGGGGSKFDTGDQPKINEESSSEGRTPKLSEYEKRIAAGQINRENLKTTFADVHAPPETISALRLLTSLALTRPDAFSYGVLASDKIPGCLLYGPPGTGKTMLAKAVAKESGANMLEISGATINDKWVGEGEKLIRAVFTLAKKLSPCVVFIDEADSLLASRSMFSRASHRELINQFLKEWDGIQETNAFIMVATNRPFDLDDAVLRRLPRKILVDLPMRDDRAAILKLLLKGEALDSSVLLEEYAERTPFYSGSDLKNVCVAAAMAAVEEENLAAAKHEGPEPHQYPQKRTLRRDHFEMALKQIPASISEDMVSLKQIRKFDEEYGRRRKGAKKSMGFGVIEDKKPIDSGLARIRQGAP